MLSPATKQALTDEAERVRIHLDAVCHTCQVRHRLGLTPQHYLLELWEWQAKHAAHVFEFLSPRRVLPQRFRDRVYQWLGWAPWWLTYQENANIKVAYAAAATIAMTFTSLASSATFVAGRESDAQDNSSNLVVDVRLTAKITTGTTATVDKEIRLYAYECLNADTPIYPDTITGANAAVTITNPYILDTCFIVLGSTAVAAVASIGYPLRLLTASEAFGPIIPKRWGLYGAHATVAALHATAGLHVVTKQEAYLTVI